MPSILQLTNDLKIMHEVFSSNLQMRELPFMGNFPRNSCEIVSALTCGALGKKYQSANVLQVLGLNPDNGQMHFWNIINDIVIDLTIHQFPNFKFLILCPRPHPLEFIYKIDEERSLELALSKLDFVGSSEIRRAVDLLAIKLDA